MSDKKLRDLERRWKESGSPEDEAAYLLERVRVGDLSREKLELAAYCGHEAAGAAVGSELTPKPNEDFYRGLLTTFEKPVWVAVAISHSRQVAVAFPIVAKVSSAACMAAEGWLSCPCEAHRADAEATWDACRSDLPPLGGADPTAFAVALSPAEVVGVASGSLIISGRAAMRLLTPPVVIGQLVAFALRRPTTDP